MITCWFYQRLIAHSLDAGQTLPERAQRHLESCPSCRQFRASELDLTRRLVADAKLQNQSPSPFLRSRIIAALDRPLQTGAPERRFLVRPIWATAFLILGLGLFGILYIRNLSVSNLPVDPRSDAGPPAPTRQFTASLSRDVMEWSKTLDRPLETEMQSVVADAKSAIQLVARNFLPEASPP